MLWVMSNFLSGVNRIARQKEKYFIINNFEKGKINEVKKKKTPLTFSELCAVDWHWHKISKTKIIVALLKKKEKVLKMIT